jgi:hypothetical protein
MKILPELVRTGLNLWILKSKTPTAELPSDEELGERLQLHWERRWWAMLEGPEENLDIPIYPWMNLPGVYHDFVNRVKNIVQINVILGLIFSLDGSDSSKILDRSGGK